jgi:hypothetical protein
MPRFAFHFASRASLVCTCLTFVVPAIHAGELKTSRDSSTLAIAKIRHDSASDQLRQAHAAVARARAQYEQLVQERFERRREAAEVTNPAQFVRNPEWNRLQSELRTALEKQSRLSERFTSAHPDMRALSLEIDTMERSIRGTPELIEASAGTSTPTAAPISAAEFTAEFELTRQIEQARQDVSAAEDAARAAQRQEQMAFEERMVLERRAVENVPPQASGAVAELPLVDRRLLQIIGVGLATLVAVLLGRLLKTPAKNTIKFSRSIISAFRATTRSLPRPSQQQANRSAKTTTTSGHQKIVPRRRNQLSQASQLHFNVVGRHRSQPTC